VLDKYWEQAQLETQKEKECKNELERRVGGIFEKLTNTAQGNELPLAENIDQIEQAIEKYQKELKTL
jgi:hypothetical protein